MLKTVRESICAGLLIALGGSVFLGCENKIVGSFLFGVALLCICFQGYYLFTGKICYLTLGNVNTELVRLLAGLLGNLLTVWLVGVLVRNAVPDLAVKAATVCEGKLKQTFPQTFLRGLFCGNLVFLAVDVFKKKGSALGIIYGVPAFIFSGFEHSIADMFYFSVGGTVNGSILGFMAAVIAGNIVGGLALPMLTPKEEK